MKLSLITISYNNKLYLENTIKSVLFQNLGEFQYIIVDGDSTDGSLEIIKKYVTLNPNIIFVSEPDNGIYDAINKGIRMANGDVIGLLHSDDLFANENIVRRVLELFKKEDADCVYGDINYVAKDNIDKVIRHWTSGKFSNERLKYGWMPPHPSFYIKKSVYDSVILDNGEYYDSSLEIAADYDLMLRVLAKPQINVAYLPEVMVKMRIGGASNRSLKAIICKMHEDYKIIKRNKIGGIYTLFLKNFRKLHQFFNLRRV
jgi:glycosyltransferase